MLGWIYQLLISFITRILSWFGLSFGAKEAMEVVETVQTLNQAKDEPVQPQEQQGPMAYSAEEAPQASP